MMLDNMTVTTETLMFPQLKFLHSVGQVIGAVGGEKGQIVRAMDEYIERKQEIYSNSVIQVGTAAWTTYSVLKNIRIGGIGAVGETLALSQAVAINGSAVLVSVGAGVGAVDIYASAYAMRMMMSGNGSSSRGSKDPCPEIEPKFLNVKGATQPEIFEETVEKMVKQLKRNPNKFWRDTLKDGPIEIWEIKGERFIYNGNHRFQAAIKAKVNIPKWAIEIKDKTTSSIPTFSFKNMDWIPGVK